MNEFEKTKKINTLAKTLKDTGLARTMDDAVKMAEEMYKKSEKNIREMKEEDISAQELIDEEFKTNPKYKKKAEIKTDLKELKEKVEEEKGD